MIEREHTNPEPSKVFEKRKGKSGFLARHLGRKGDVEDNEIPLALSQPTPTLNTPVRKKDLLSLLKDDDEDEEKVPTPLPDLPGKKDLLSLLKDDDEENVPPLVVEDLLTGEDYQVIEDDHDNIEDEVPNTSVLREIEFLNDEDVSSTTTYQDTVENVIKNEVEPLETQADIIAKEGYEVVIETLTTKVILEHGVPNVSLESFGIVASTYEPRTLEIATFGKHKFTGNPLTDEQKVNLYSQIERRVEDARKENRSHVCLKATQRVLHEGIIYHSLLLSDEFLEHYMNAFNRSIMTNGDTASVPDLAVIVNL